MLIIYCFVCVIVVIKVFIDVLGFIILKFIYSIIGIYLLLIESL